MLKQKRKIDFINGKILSKIIIFIIPILATNLLQVFYNAADMMIVSLSNEENAIGAIGTTTAFVNLIVNTFIGFSVGANVIVARYVGAKDRDMTEKAVHTAVLMSFIFGFLGSILGLIITRPVLSLMGNTGNLLDLAVEYTLIYFLGVPFVSATNYLIAILRAKGDSNTPLVVLSLSGLLNVILNLFFVIICHLSVEGVAIATVISNIISTVILIIKLTKDNDYTKLSFKKLKIDSNAFKSIILIGIPAGIQSSLFSISNMLIQSSVVTVNNNLCPPDIKIQPVVNGSAAAGNIESFIYTAVNSVYHGAITFTSQNLGANKYERINKIMYSCFFISAIISLIFCSSIYIFMRPLLSLYGIIPGEEGTVSALAFETAVKRLKVMCSTYIICGFMEVCTGVLRGLGKSLTSTVNTLVGTCVLRVFWILVIFPLNESIFNIFISYPISWFLTTLVSYLCILYVMKKIKRKQP